MKASPFLLSFAMISLLANKGLAFNCKTSLKTNIFVSSAETAGLSKILTDRGLVALKHGSTLEYFLSIIYSGEISPRSMIQKKDLLKGQKVGSGWGLMDSYPGVGQSAFFVGLMEGAIGRPLHVLSTGQATMMDRFSVFLIISPNVLNRKDYLVNPDFISYGDYIKNITLTPAAIKRKRILPLEVSEYAFSQPIPMDDILMAIVHPDKKDELQRLLQKYGMSESDIPFPVRYSPNNLTPKKYKSYVINDKYRSQNPLVFEAHEKLKQRRRGLSMQ